MGLGPLALLTEYAVPARLRSAGYDVAVEEIPDPEPQHREIWRTFEIDRRLAHAVRAAVEADRVPVVLSGNCNSALGTTAGLGGRLSVLWFDAHADFDVPDDNLSGFLDVMALASLTGATWKALCNTIPGFRAIPEDRIVLVGVRDLASYQRRRLEASGIRLAPGGSGALAVLEETAGSHLDATSGTSDGVYVHVDFDSLDDRYGPANEYAAPFGLTVDQLVGTVAAARRSSPVKGLAFTAYDPTRDAGGTFGGVAARVVEAVVRAALE